MRLLLAVCGFIGVFGTTAHANDTPRRQLVFEYNDDQCTSVKAVAWSTTRTCQQQACDQRSSMSCSDDLGSSLASAFADRTYFSMNDFSDIACSSISTGIAFVAAGNCVSVTGRSYQVTVGGNGGVTLSTYSDTSCANMTATARIRPSMLGKCVTAAQSSVRYSLVSPPKPVQLRLPAKSLCLDDGGAKHSGNTFFHAKPCDSASDNQWFYVDADNGYIRSASKKNLCIQGGWESLPDYSLIQLANCNSSNPLQQVLYDESTQLIIVPSKNKCFDSVEASENTPGVVQLRNCDHLNSNQLFDTVDYTGVFIMTTTLTALPTMPAITAGAYDAMMNGATVMFRSVLANTLCVDDGGGTDYFLLYECDQANTNQRFVYDKTTQQFRNPTKAYAACMDDGGYAGSDLTFFHAVNCMSTNSNQYLSFDQTKQAIVSASKGTFCMRTNHGVDRLQLDSCDYTLALEIVVLSRPSGGGNGNKKAVQFRSVHKQNLCVDDGGGTHSGSTFFALYDCDATNLNQWFYYDTTSGQIASAAKANLCAQAGWNLLPSTSIVELHTCNTTTPKQQFVYDASTKLLKSRIDNSCIDDGGCTAKSQTVLQLAACNSASYNQQFEIVEYSGQFSGSVALTTPPAVPAPATNGYAAMMNGQTVMFRSILANTLCVDDGGNDFYYHLYECSTTNGNQQFVYDSAKKLFRNPTKTQAQQNPCMDDGGYSGPGTGIFHGSPCDSLNNNQYFAFDQNKSAIITKSKGTNLCVRNINQIARLQLDSCDHALRLEIVVPDSAVKSDAAQATSGIVLSLITTTLLALFLSC